MAKSCKGLAEELVKCLSESDCVKVEKRSYRECAGEKTPCIPSECVGLRETYFNCKRGQKKMEPKQGSTEPFGVDPNGLGPVARVKKLLACRTLVGVNDGRFFMGGFHCIDKQGNIILQDAMEFRSVRRSSPSPVEQRGLGLVLIPRFCRTSCRVDCSMEEQLSLLSLGDQ